LPNFNYYGFIKPLKKQKKLCRIFIMEQGNHAARPKKIAVLGAGRIGQELMHDLTREGAADQVVIYNRRRPDETQDRWDTPEFVAEKLTTDQKNRIRRRRPGAPERTDFHYTHNIAEALQGADIVVVTAGVPRKDGMERPELLAKNAAFISDIADAAKEHAPNANYVIATNPVDTITQTFQERSGVPANKVMGLSGELDRARFEQSLSFQLNKYAKEHGQPSVEPEHIYNIDVVGQHGGTMVPMMERVEIDRHDGKGPIKLMDFLNGDEEKLAEIKAATVGGGGRIVKLGGTSDYKAPAGALHNIVDALIDAKYRGVEGERIYASVKNEDNGVYIGQPSTLNRDGTHNVQPIEGLSRGEQAAWDTSVRQCQTEMSIARGEDKPQAPRKPGEGLAASEDAADMASRSPRWSHSKTG
jgi:malate dehydrogenase